MNVNLHNYTVTQWISYYSKLERYGIIGYLDELLWDLDCSRLYKGQQIITTDCFAYKDLIEHFYRTHAKLTNYIIANKYYEKLIKLHEDNIDFEKAFNNTYVEEKPKKVRPKTPKIKNEFIKHETTDMFTGETLYTYDNLKTGESIVSENPNLLEELNAKPKKEKVKKVTTIQISNLTFNFKKK